MKVIQLRKIYLLFISLALSTSSYADVNFPTLPPANTVIPGAPTLSAKSYILVDPLSDYVMAEQAADERVEPASLTKMMTVYVADQAIKANKLKPTDIVTIGERAWRTQGSRTYLDLNTTVTVDDLMRGIIIQSGNDASVALAEHIAGDEKTFAELMNHYAKELGMKNTNFVNSTGLPDPNQYTTARDLAMLGKALVRDFPETYKIYSQKEYTFHNIKQNNRNRLLWKNDWVDGIKTGHTDTAGYCLVASGVKEGMRLIAVVMGTKSDGIRTDEANNLLTYGFRFYETRKLYPANTPVKQARVWMGAKKEIDLGLNEDLFVTIGRGQFDKLKANIVIDKQVKAPMEKGSVLGKISVNLDDKLLIEKPIIALNKVEAAGFFGRLYDSISLSLHKLWEKATS